MTLEELDKLDDTEIIRGYAQARKGYELSGMESPSFVHGYKNGLVDSGRARISEDQIQLARAFVARQKSEAQK